MSPHAGTASTSEPHELWPTSCDRIHWSGLSALRFSARTFSCTVSFSFVFCLFMGKIVGLQQILVFNFFWAQISKIRGIKQEKRNDFWEIKWISWPEVTKGWTCFDRRKAAVLFIAFKSILHVLLPSDCEWKVTVFFWLQLLFDFFIFLKSFIFSFLLLLHPSVSCCLQWFNSVSLLPFHPFSTAVL